jgi:hypothetical protein
MCDALVRRGRPLRVIPYVISLDRDGCPVIPEQLHFVDAPGQLVPPDPTDAVLCATPTGLVPAMPGYPVEPRVRVLRAGAVDFAALLNGLPDRNADWRQWQRKHSGFWPDAVPQGYGTMCLMMAYPYDYSFVLRYENQPPVALISKCGTWGLTTGVRTRMDMSKPHVKDAFLERFNAQR